MDIVASNGNAQRAVINCFILNSRLQQKTHTHFHFFNENLIEKSQCATSSNVLVHSFGVACFVFMSTRNILACSLDLGIKNVFRATCLLHGDCGGHQSYHRQFDGFVFGQKRQLVEFILESGYRFFFVQNPVHLSRLSLNDDNDGCSN